MSFPPAASVVDFIRERTQRQPDAVAVKAAGRQMTFGELDRVSNRVANFLLRNGLRPEDVVGVAVEQSFAYVAVALGVLKAGGSYLPIDKSIPDQRLHFLLEDSGAKFLFAQTAQLKRIRWNGNLLAADDESPLFPGESESEVGLRPDPARRAYIIYTSGSTGVPKGVEVEHHSLSNLVCNFMGSLKLTGHDRATLLANVAFDASVADLWPCLCAGGAVLVPPKGVMNDLDGLIAWLAAEGATYSFVPTAIAELLLSRPWPERMALRFLGTGGDTLHVRPPAGLPFQFINGYGPTENTVVSTWTVVSSGSTGNRPPIGEPIGNVRVYVLDEQRRPVGDGEEGEMYLGGEQVARGYLNRPELTQERFLPDPFANNPGARMYRTGDWARRLSNGQLEFVGRRDDQVQIRGRRVELGEIERELHIHRAVRQACCRPFYEGDAVTGVIAHVAADVRDEEFAGELRTHLAARLPSFMVPSDFIFYEKLPLTGRGKVDRGALRASRLERLSVVEAGLPADSQERALARLWYELLPQARGADVQATFNSLGGDSLQAIKLMLGVEKIIGRPLPVSSFLLDPTLPGLCRTVRKSRSEDEAHVIALRSEGSLPPLFCLYGVGGDVGHYFEFARAIGEDQPVYAVRSTMANDPSAQPQTIEEAAGQAGRWIREFYPEGPVALLGYSWGGFLAFEIARQWERAGQPTPFVGLVGTPAPFRRIGRWERISHFVRKSPGWMLQILADYLKGRRQLPGIGKIGSRLKTRLINDPSGEKPGMPEWASTPLSRHHIGMAHVYHPPMAENVDLNVFRERENYEQYDSWDRSADYPFLYPDTSHELDGGWGRWTRREPQVHWMNSNHDDVLKPSAVAELAAVVKEALRARRRDEHFADVRVEATDAQVSRRLSFRVPSYRDWMPASLAGGVAIIALIAFWVFLDADNAMATIQNDAQVVIVGADSRSITNPGPGYILKPGDEIQSHDEHGVELQFGDAPLEVILRDGADVAVSEYSETPALFVEMGTVDVEAGNEEFEFILHTPHGTARTSSGNFTLTVTSDSTTVESTGGEVELIGIDGGKSVTVQDRHYAIIEPGNPPVVALIGQSRPEM